MNQRQEEQELRQVKDKENFRHNVSGKTEETVMNTLTLRKATATMLCALLFVTSTAYA